jgi:hypothetical protein
VLPDSRIRLYLMKVEMGQGVHTALAQVAAEELGIGWSDLDVAQASTEREHGRFVDDQRQQFGHGGLRTAVGGSGDLPIDAGGRGRFAAGASADQVVVGPVVCRFSRCQPQRRLLHGCDKPGGVGGAAGGGFLSSAGRSTA